MNARSDQPTALPSRPATAGTAGPEGRVHLEARGWLGLALGSLVIAGLLSLFVVLGRIPVLSGWFADPHFFQRCLVAHVNLSLAVWFYAFIAALLALTRRESGGPAARLALAAAAGGAVIMTIGVWSRGAEPILSNYIPVIDHPVFLTGLGLFFAGVLARFGIALAGLRGGADGLVPAGPSVGLAAAAVAVFVAGVTWLAALAGLPRGMEASVFYEFSFWGPGHALQVANVCAMLAVWLWVLERSTGTPVLQPRPALVLFSLLLLPHFALPLLTLRGTLDPLYYTGATQLMRWGIFPVVLVVLGLCLHHLRRHRRPAHRPLVARALLAGFAGSAGLTLFGFILGACIRGSNTLIPAHYHASLGGVTLAFMTAAFLVVAAAGATRTDPARLWTGARRQLPLFAIGQSVFVLGFALGGVFGLLRKAYSSDQYVRSAGEIAGLSVMGIGGLAAAAAGLWFLFLMLREIRGWLHVSAPPVSAALFPTPHCHENQS